MTKTHTVAKSGIIFIIYRDIKLVRFHVSKPCQCVNMQFATYSMCYLYLIHVHLEVGLAKMKPFKFKDSEHAVLLVRNVALTSHALVGKLKTRE